VNERDRKLLVEGYITGMQHGAIAVATHAEINDIKAEAERWVDEPIADNGGTVGQYICWEIDG